MNEKDYQAFDKWHDENIANPPTLNELINKAWIGACEHKQKEIDELLTENAKLRHCVEFYADKSRSNSIFNPDYHNEEDCDFHEDTQFTHFGKRARQVLKELEEK